MRVWRHLLLLFCALALIAPHDAGAVPRHKTKHARVVRKAPDPATTGVNDPRYAAIVLNPKTGEVYHSQDPDERRYPASLTKMMTLYLLFEALEQHKVSLNTELTVSDYATIMPQTNLSLTTADRIPVETAIKALVVRSANDVAVVVAENLAGSTQAFAKLMTEKARKLGMRNTVFKNPNGLPDGEQFTTARDMAKLGIALRRDFPEYYQYFSTRQFSWNGVTYYTHNRVMLRYPGCDGIKTGYIGLSGFNVVTSAERGGRPLVGVVMGGTTANWRDDRMIQLLDAAYTTIAQRGNAGSRVVASNLPSDDGQPVAEETPAPKPPVVAVQVRTPASAEHGVIRQQPAETMNVAVATPQPAPVKVIEPAETNPIVTAPPAPTAPLSAVSVPAATPPPLIVAAPAPVAPPGPKVITMAAPRPASPAPNTLDAQLAALQNKQTRSDSGVGDMWGIQVGAFSSRELAENAAMQAYRLAQRNLQGSRISVLGTGTGASATHRARLENITQNQAKKACETLISNNSPCFIFRAGQAQNL